MKVDYEKYENRIPYITLETLRNYIEYGVATGGFLHSVLTDSLFGTFEKADDKNREALGDIVMFVYNEAPGDCWGSDENVKEWYKKEGLQGRGAYVPYAPVTTILQINPVFKPDFFPAKRSDCNGETQ